MFFSEFRNKNDKKVLMKKIPLIAVFSYDYQRDFIGLIYDDFKGILLCAHNIYARFKRDNCLAVNITGGY